MWLVLSIAACDPPLEDTDQGGDTDTDVAPIACADATGTGTLALSFRMEDDYIPSMDEPPVGTFHGSVFDGADVTAIGPNEGAVALLDFEASGVDLSTGGGPTGVLLVTDPLPACRVSILGCLDSDANDCDAGDPITLPNDSYAEVTADAETPHEVFMGLLNPS